MAQTWRSGRGDMGREAFMGSGLHRLVGGARISNSLVRFLKCIHGAR
jgi:hypothetical protein